MKFCNFSKTTQAHGLQTININIDVIKECAKAEGLWYFISIDDEGTLRCFSMHASDFLDYEACNIIGQKADSHYIVYLDPYEGELFSESKMIRQSTGICLKKIFESPEVGDLSFTAAVNKIQEFLGNVEFSINSKNTQFVKHCPIPQDNVNPIKFISSQSTTPYGTHWLNIPANNLMSAIKYNVNLSIICYDGFKRTLKCYTLDPLPFLREDGKQSITQMGKTGKYSVYLNPTDSGLYRSQNPIHSEKIMQVTLLATLENF